MATEGHAIMNILFTVICCLFVAGVLFLIYALIITSGLRSRQGRRRGVEE
jgi:capsule polysaccharide export protein KpsE/RkpR